MIKLLLGDCRLTLAGITTASVDAIVTDPPYELGFMGKKWDASGIAYSVDLWREVLRVLKPGGHLLAFGGTRTYHRMACAIEDAGFEIRDSLHWLYGSGFPKSLDISKALDKAGGIDTKAFKADLRDAVARSGLTRKAIDDACGFTMRFDTPYEDDPRCWGVSLPSPEKWVMICSVLGLDASRWSELVGRVWRGRAGKELSENGSMSGANYERADKGEAVHDAARQWEGWGTALKPAHEPIVLARKPLDGTVAANVAAHGTGGLNVDACRLQSSEVPAGRLRHGGGKLSDKIRQLDPDARNEMPAGRWPPNMLLTHSANCDEECAPDCPVAELDRQSGILKSGNVTKTYSPALELSPALGAKRRKLSPESVFADSGGASRFFPVFRYCAKPSRRERDLGCEDLPAKTGGEATDREDGSAGTKNPRAGAGRTGGARNYHPTVKPIALMRWLVRLVTPPGGIVLDPFLGSGTTGCAAVAEGFRFIGIECEAEYLEIAKRRIAAFEPDLAGLLADPVFG